MPKSKEEKKQIVQNLIDLFKKMKSAVLVDFKGLKVKEITQLRRLCREQGISYNVAKKTLLKIAAAEAGVNFDAKAVEGSYAVVFGLADEIAPAKILSDFAKKNEALKILSGILEGKTVDKSAILAIAKLPGKLELLAKLAASIQAPLSGLVNVMAGNLRGLVNVLNGIKETKS